MKRKIVAWVFLIFGISCLIVGITIPLVFRLSKTTPPSTSTHLSSTSSTEPPSISITSSTTKETTTLTTTSRTSAITTRSPTTAFTTTYTTTNNTTTSATTATTPWTISMTTTSTTTSRTNYTTTSTKTATTTVATTTTARTTKTSTITTTTPISCEDYFCHQGNVCPNREKTAEVCPDFYTGVDCKIPPKFVRQMHPGKPGEYFEANFITALNVCNMQGGYLAFFISDEEFYSYITDRDRHVQEYIGYVTCDNPNFVNADGEESRYENWDAYQPDNKDGIEFCGGLSTNDKMNDVPCNQMLEFSCRLPRS